ncbi:MAG: hypothetical protein QM496_05670 [Verrucomicrobiota bacterium]
MKYLKGIKFSNLLALAAMIFGVWYCAVWTLAAAELSSDYYSPRYGLWSYLTVFSSFILKLSPGILAFHYGYQLLRKKTEANFRRLIGIFTFFAMVMSVGRVSLFLDSFMPDFKSPISMLFVMLIGLPLYMSLVSFFLRREGLSVDSFKNVIGRWPFAIMALQLFVLIAALFDYYGLMSDHLFESENGNLLEFGDWRVFLSIITLFILFFVPLKLYSFTINRLELGKIKHDKTIQNSPACEV